MTLGRGLLITRPGVSYQYDNNGNTISMTDSSGTTTYVYDYENRLIELQTPNAQLVSYSYDPFGRRIEKTVNGAITRYVYDREDILFELDASGNIITEYLHGPGIDEPIAMTKNNQTYYYHADALGSIIAITDSAGNVVQRYEYDSFGQITYQLDSNFKQPYSYTGREYDEESGLYYYRARYYDARIGRFISEDPIGFAGGINFYAYVGNDPVNWIDPEGFKRGGGRGRGRIPPNQQPPRGNEDAGKLFDNFGNLLDPPPGNFMWSFEWRCVEMTCEPTNYCPDPKAPKFKGPWIVSPDSNSCKCVKWKKELVIIK